MVSQKRAWHRRLRHYPRTLYADALILLVEAETLTGNTQAAITRICDVILLLDISASTDRTARDRILNAAVGRLKDFLHEPDEGSSQMELLSGVIETYPEQGILYAIRAEERFRRGENTLAFAVLARAMELESPQHEKLKVLLANGLSIRAGLRSEQQAWGDAAAAWEQVIPHAPNDPSNRDTLAKIYVQMERWDKLIAEYTEAIQRDPTVRGNDWMRVWLTREQNGAQYPQHGHFDLGHQPGSASLSRLGERCSG